MENKLIHPTAIVDSTASLENGVQLGPYAIIGKQVQIKKDTIIGAHAIIGDYTSIGERCQIFSHAVVGTSSQDLKHKGEISFLKIGNDNIIREFATINRATTKETETIIGHHNLLMAYVHVAHDCVIGDHNVLANGVNLGGHVTIENHVTLGAMTGIHQFVQIGEKSMVGAMSKVCQDVLPYMLANGDPPGIYGINTVGLRRLGVSGQVRRLLKQAFQIIYRQQLPLEQAIVKLEQMLPQNEIQHLIQFIAKNQRGICGLGQSNQQPDMALWPISPDQSA